MNNLKVSTGTIVRTILLAVALINQILTATGHSVLPIDNAQLEEILTALFTIVTSILAGWKNNSFTRAALIGDEVMKKEKARVKDNGIA